MDYLNKTSINILLNIEMGMAISDLKKIVKKGCYVSLILANLEVNKIIDIVPDTKDKRNRIIFLTDKGLLLQTIYGWVKDIMEDYNGSLCKL